MNVSRHHDVVPDLLWDDVKDWFDLEWNGSLPDVAVRHTTQSDWQAVVDLVRSNGWAYEYSEDGRVLRMPSRVEAMVDRAAQANVILKVWPAPGLLAAFRPHEAEEILFDVDLREIQSQERLNALCSFLRAIGRRLGKPALMSPEGFGVRPVLGLCGRTVSRSGAAGAGADGSGPVVECRASTSRLDSLASTA